MLSVCQTSEKKTKSGFVRVAGKAKFYQQFIKFEKLSNFSPANYQMLLRGRNVLEQMENFFFSSGAIRAAIIIIKFNAVQKCLIWADN